MKVKFDIKYRQQIESGEYKVETVDGRQVRIVCWDAHNPYRENDIVALATSSSGEGENILRYYSNGHLVSDSANVGNKDLMVVITGKDEKVRNSILTLITKAWYADWITLNESMKMQDYIEKSGENERMPGEVAISLNDDVCVILTRSGAKFINDSNREKNEAYGTSKKTNYEEGDEYSSQLWVLISDFAPVCDIGKELPFSTMKIKEACK